MPRELPATTDTDIYASSGLTMEIPRRFQFRTRPPRGIWSVWWIGWRRRLLRLTPQDALRWLLLGPLTLLFMVMAGILFHRLWGTIWLIPGAGTAVAATLWSAFLAFVTVFLFYSNLLTALTTFYGAEDLPLLLSAPLPYWRLHVQRCIETIVRSSAMILFILCPALIAQWMVAETTWLHRGFGVAAVVMLILGSGLLGTWTGQIVAALLPARRVTQVLVLAGLALAGSLVVALRAMRLELLWAEGVDVSLLLGRLDAAAGPLARFRPAREAVGWILGHPAGTDLPHAPWGMLGMLFMGLLLLSFGAERRFWAGWLRAGVGSGSLAAPWPANTAWMRRAPWAGSALITKDILTELRTGRRWSQLMMMVPLGAVYVINLRFIPGDTGQVSSLFGWLNLLFASFLVVAICTRFLVPVASMEGRASWVWRSGPITARRWFAAKLWGYLPLTVCTGLGFFLLGQWGAGVVSILSPRLLMYVLVNSLAVGAAALALGAAFPVPGVRHELQASLGAGGLLFIVASLGYLLLVGYVLVWPALGGLEAARILNWQPSGPPGPPWMWVAGGSMMLVLPAAWLAVHRWSREGPG